MGKLTNIVCSLFLFVIALTFLCSTRTLILIYTRPEGPSPCHLNESEGYISADEGWLRFKRFLQFRTESFAPHEYNRQELKKGLDFLISSYADVFQHPNIQYDIINNYSLLITVKGENRSLIPYMLCAHMDVVPVIQEEWTYDGYAASESEDGSMVYARGAIDNKSPLIAQLEALKFMVSLGHRPQRGFFLAFGHDEEVGGHDGAAEIAKFLSRRGVRKLDFIVDEGVPVLESLFPGFKKNIAGFGVSEKGSLTLNLSVHLEGGHSSMPSSQSSIGVLSSALAKLEENPHDIIFDEMTQNFVEKLSLDMPFPRNVLTSNLWLFKPIVARSLTKGVAEAMVRTTTAVTMFHGGIKSNVIPPSAWAVVNHRVHPKQSIAEIVKRDTAIINDDRVVIKVMPNSYEPHPISPHNSDVDRPFRIVEKTTLQLFPDTIAAPFPLIANTDTQHYLGFTKHIFRLYPYILHAKTELHRIHGRDERLSKEKFESAMNFFYHLMRNADEYDAPRDIHSHSAEL